MENNKQPFYKFVKQKLTDVNIIELIFLEFESWTLIITGFIPGLIGVLFRSFVLKLLLQKSDGLPMIQVGVTMIYTSRIKIGKFFAANTGTYINGKGNITFGNYVLIGSNVTISSGMHPIDNKDIPIFSRPTVPKEIIIEDDVWIGAGAVIMPGVVLRKGTVVGANSVVTKSTEEYSILVGAPAKKIKIR